MIKLNGNYVASLRRTPESLLDDLENSRITKQDAIIAVGMMLYGKGADALFTRKDFKNFWTSRIGGRKSFEAATQDTNLTAEETKFVQHMLTVADRLQRVPSLDGCWELLGDHTAFKVANALSPKGNGAAAVADIDDEPYVSVPEADLTLKAGLAPKEGPREMTSGHANRARNRAGISDRPFQP